MIVDAEELHRRYLQRIAGVQDNKVYIGPEIVTLEITSACTLRCRYCSADHTPGNPFHFKKPNFLPWEKFLEIVRDSVELKVDQINILGGEPALHPQFRDMMRHLEQQPLQVMLLTNGTFPLDYCSDAMKADHIIIDISAVDRQQYLDMHGNDFFDRVVANMERLVFLRDTRKPRLLFEIAYIVNTFNVDQQQKMRDLASRIGIKDVYFCKMHTNQYNCGIALSEQEGDEKRALSQCLNGWFYMHVSPGANFSHCDRIPLMKHHGDRNKMSLNKLWFSSFMMKRRLLSKYGQIQKKFEKCQNCSFYYENKGLLQNQYFWRKV